MGDGRGRRVVEGKCKVTFASTGGLELHLYNTHMPVDFVFHFLLFFPSSLILLFYSNMRFSPILFFVLVMEHKYSSFFLCIP